MQLTFQGVAKGYSTGVIGEKIETTRSLG